MIYYISNELSHHGVKGMKWGVRKQRQSLGGRARRGLASVYGLNESFYRRTGNRTLASMNAQAKNAQLKKAELADQRKQAKLNDPDHKARVAKAKKAAKVGAAVAVTALAIYGGKKLHDKQVLQMANAMAERGYGKGPNYFSSYKDVKNAWDGNYRQMINDVRDYSPYSSYLSDRELKSMGIQTIKVLNDSANKQRFR